MTQTSCGLKSLKPSYEPINTPRFISLFVFDHPEREL